MRLSLSGMQLGAEAADGALLPCDVPGLVLESDSRFGVSVAAGDVAAWANQTGGTGWTQPLVSQRPEYNEDGPLPFIRFDGANQEYLVGTSPGVLFGADPLSIFIVASLSGASTPMGIYGQLTSPWLLIKDTSAVYRGPGGELSFPRNAALAVRSFHHDGADYYYREDGVELDRATKALGAHAGSGGRLGRQLSASFWLSGDVYAVLFYSRTTGLTAAEIIGIEAYLTGEFL